MRSLLLVIGLFAMGALAVTPLATPQLTQAKFSITNLWITPYGYDPGSLAVTKVFTNEQYWFGGTITKSGQESANVHYIWTFDGIQAADQSAQVQSGEVLVFSSPAILAKVPSPTFVYKIILLFPGTHKFTLTLQWQSASGYSDSVSSELEFNVVQNPTETQTSVIQSSSESQTMTPTSNTSENYTQITILIAGVVIGGVGAFAAMKALAGSSRRKSKHAQNARV